MNEYFEKICPFCKSGFQEGDEIVICSSCDMPHHKDCWIENQGCTTFGCSGTIKSVGGSATSVTVKEISFYDAPVTNNSTIYCSKCGTPSDNSASFCSKCGYRLTASVSAHTDPACVNTPGQQYARQQSYSQYNDNGYSQATAVDGDVARLVGPKSEYYLPKFQEFKQQSKKNSWNWAAFLLTPYWFIYRKMYLYGYGILAVAFVLSYFPILSFVVLGGYIALGIFANYIYMNDLEKKAQKARSMNEPLRSEYLSKSGGTNTLVAVLTAIGYAILVVIASI